MIDGVLIEKLKIISDERGCVFHMLRKDSPFFEAFGEVYFSVVNVGFIKGWKKHLKQTQHFVVPVGNIKLVIYDDRIDSVTKGEVQEIILGVDEYKLVRIPWGVWYSFSPLGGSSAMIANCSDIPHEVGECISKDINNNEIPYSWEIAH